MAVKSVVLIISLALSIAIAFPPPLQSYQQQETSLTSSSPLLVMSTRFFNTNTGQITTDGQHHSMAVPNFHLDANNCPDKLAIYIHGIWADEQTAEEQYGRVADSYMDALKRIDANQQPMPVVLHSWDSNTTDDIEGNGWRTAQHIANENGKFLANSLLDISNSCNSQLHINVVAHSLGARVILQALQELNNTNLAIKSVHLMGAAVDDELVSKNPDDNSDSPRDGRTVYGEAIQTHVKQFYNLYNPSDDFLRGWRWPYTYYPSYERDIALGNGGIDPSVTSANVPTNYVDINVQNYIPSNTMINFTDANGDGHCDLIENVFGEQVCGIHSQGDNHMGYMGFRDYSSKQILDDGAMAIVANDGQSN